MHETWILDAWYTVSLIKKRTKTYRAVFALVALRHRQLRGAQARGHAGKERGVLGDGEGDGGHARKVVAAEHVLAHVEAGAERHGDKDEAEDGGDPEGAAAVVVGNGGKGRQLLDGVSASHGRETRGAHAALLSWNKAKESKELYGRGCGGHEETGSASKRGRLCWWAWCFGGGMLYHFGEGTKKDVGTKL